MMTDTERALQNALIDIAVTHPRAILSAWRDARARSRSEASHVREAVRGLARASRELDARMAATGGQTLAEYRARSRRFAGRRR